MGNVQRSVEAINKGPAGHQRRQAPGAGAQDDVRGHSSSGAEKPRALQFEEAFRQSDADNPFFAEELALVIKALNGKGSEKEGDRRRSDKSYK